MSLPVTSVMLIFWLFMAYRTFQRDDIPMAALMRPSLTTITQFSIDIGRSLAEMLFDRIEGRETGPARRCEIPLRLIERQST